MENKFNEDGRQDKHDLNKKSKLNSYLFVINYKISLAASTADSNKVTEESLTVMSAG